MVVLIMTLSQNISGQQHLFKFNAIKDSLTVLNNGIVKVGINLALGGAITYLSDAKGKGNIVNNSDWGRQIQLSFYGGPKPYTRNGKQPPANWRNLGWNPIQSGDFRGNRSKVLQFKNDGKTIYVKTKPMQWPLNNEPCDCSFESWITLEGNTVQVRAKLNNNREDHKQYEGVSQELPALFTVAAYDNLVTYRGFAPFTGDKVSKIENENPPGKPIQWATWEGTENWAAALNDNGWGIGIWNPSTQHYLGGFTGTKKARGTGERSFETTYIAPAQQEILDYNITYEYTYVIIIGTLHDIRSYAYKHSNVSKKLGYNFTSDRQHWIYKGTTDSGWPIKGFLNINLTKGAAMVSPTLLLKTSEVSSMQLNAAYNSSSASKGAVYWRKFGEKGFSEENSQEFDIPKDKQFHLIDIPLRKNPRYNGNIVQIKVVLSKGGVNQGDMVKVKSIDFK